MNVSQGGTVEPVGAFEFEGSRVTVMPGDTVASALYRAGVRTFSRSFKYHRRRGLYCLTGDCPNCLLNVDGEARVCACTTPAEGVRQVRRENGWPSVEHDLLAAADRVHRLLPVGFYYKAMLRPKWLWPMLEPLIRSAAGRGKIDLAAKPTNREVRHLHPQLLVIGGGVAGLAAALAGAEAGLDVVLCDEGRLGEKVPPGPTRDRIDELADAIRLQTSIAVLERAPAVGVYQGPLVPVNAGDLLQLVHPDRVVVATGAHEQHDVFPGGDLPGVWLGRGASCMAGVHGVMPGRKAVVVGAHHEVEEQVETLRTAGVETVAFGDTRIERALGRRSVTAVVVEGYGRIACDVLVLARAFSPRDGLLRQGDGLAVVGAGQVVLPECSLEQAEESGRRAVFGKPLAATAQPLPAAVASGYVCLCEDVTVGDLQDAWTEGYQTTEILKRYTTATMGTCQGALCHAHLRQFVAAHTGDEALAAGPTTARPPAGRITLEEAAAGHRAELHQRTALHERHLAFGATMEPAGTWRRPERYGDIELEYWAVRRHVSVMDVGTLGKFLVGGSDALDFLERLYPCRVADLGPGRIRYGLLLGQHGFVIDDGVICALGGGCYYLTFTSGGADQAEAHLRDWIETWGLEVYVVNRTAAFGAINVAGPRARDLLRRLSRGELDAARFPYLHHREIDVAGVPCRALRLGFVGELSYELHHPSSRSAELWDALLAEGVDLQIRPHGLEALRLLRLEKGHLIVGQDTDYDSTPEKLGMQWAADLDKPYFVGKTALERIDGFQAERRLLALRFEREAPVEGTPLHVNGKLVGHLTSSRFSPVLGYGVGLGWSKRVNGEFPDVVEANGSRGTVVTGPFFDPEGVRVRA
jgi:sarcosine oxidase subunit alpha